MACSGARRLAARRCVGSQPLFGMLRYLPLQA